MQQLDLTHKMAVAHCAFQLIASAEGNMDEERDFSSIQLVLQTLNISIYLWDSAVKQNPHDCFFHVSEFSEANKTQFRELMYRLCEQGGNQNLRRICAESLFSLCGIA